MATQTNALPANSPITVAKVKTDAERRREPRFGAEGEVTVVVMDGPMERELVAKLLDFSLHGLKVIMKENLAAETEVRVFFSWGEVATQVVRTTTAPGGFEIGLQLF